MSKNIFSKIFSKLFIFAVLFFLLFILSHNTVSAQTTGTGQNCFANPARPGEKICYNDNPDQPTTDARTFSTTKECVSPKVKQTYEGNEICVDPNFKCDKGYDVDLSSGSQKCVKQTTRVMAWIIELITDIFGWIGKKILEIINWFLNGILKLASLAFDFTVYFSVAKFKSNFGDLNLDVSGGYATNYLSLGAYTGGSGGSLIYYIWGMLRDFLNVFIFFVIIYHAVYSMFEGFDETRKKFITILVFSIVVNFSLLFVKIAIDISNILTLQAYTLMVQPSGLGSFKEFGTPAFEGAPKSFGEYIKNRVSFGKLNVVGDQTVLQRNGNNQNQSEKSEVTDLEDTFMAQLGKMIVLVGLIYILFYLTGFFLLRAGVFLYAMILAPFLAADLYFDTFSKSEGGNTIAKYVRDITTPMRGDFYESLIKGPVLMFFIFLIGVFASAIFGGNIEKELQTSISSINGLGDMSTSLVNSLFVFMKFALFFTLTMFAFKAIEKIPLANGGKHMDKLSQQLARLTLGKGMGGLAALGRNTVGRGVAKLGLQQSFANLGRRTTDYLSKDRSQTNILGRTLAKTGQYVAEKGIGTVNRFQKGTYDLRNPLGTGRLGSLIKGVTGIDASKGDLGQVGKDGFEARDKAKLDARKSVEEQRTKIFADNLGSGDVVENSTKKVEVGGVELQLKEMKSLMDKFADNQFTTDANGKVTFTGVPNKGSVSFDRDTFTRIFDKSKSGSMDEAFSKLKESETKAIEEENKNKFKKLRTAQIAAGNARTVGDSLNLADRLTSGTVRTMEKEASEELAKSTLAKSREDDRKKIQSDREKGQKKSVVDQLVKDLDKTIGMLTSARQNGASNDVQVRIDELNRLKSEIAANSNVDNLKYFEGNTDLIEKVIRTKESAAEIVKNEFSGMRKVSEDEERALQKQIADGKRGVNRRDYDSWKSELQIMESADRSEKRRPEFKARQRKLLADVASADRNGISLPDSELKVLEDNLREKQKQIKEINSQFGSGREIEQISEKTRRTFNNQFGVKVEKAPDTPTK